MPARARARARAAAGSRLPLTRAPSASLPCLPAGFLSPDFFVNTGIVPYPDVDYTFDLEVCDGVEKVRRPASRRCPRARS